VVVAAPEHEAQHVFQVGGVDHVREQGAGKAPGGFGEKAGGGKNPAIHVQGHLLFLGEQVQHPLAQSGLQLGPGFQEIAQGVEPFPGGVAVLGPVRTQLIH